MEHSRFQIPQAHLSVMVKPRHLLRRQVKILPGFTSIVPNFGFAVAGRRTTAKFTEPTAQFL